MTDIRALAAKATPGPWRVILPGDVHWADRRKFRCVAFSTRRDEPYTTSPLRPEDAALICAMRNGIEALLDEREAAEKALAGARSVLSQLVADFHHVAVGQATRDMLVGTANVGIGGIDAALAAGSGR